jgi:hypothetical protein
MVKWVCSDALPSPKLGPKWALVSKTAELWGLEGTVPTLNTKKGRGACWSFGMGLGRGTSFSYSLEPASNQLNKLVNSHSRAPLVLGQATGNSRLQWCVALYLHTLGSGRFPTFSGRESNWQFDSRPFFLS